MRRLDKERLIIATHNKGKLEEVRDLLTPYVSNIVSAGDLNLPEPEETGTTFVENAVLKARAAAAQSGSPALADDSGLCVNALGGKPGILSARWGGPHKDFSAAMQRVQNELGTAADRSAYFICVLALVWPDQHTEIFEGRADGTLVWPGRGTNGHGYDPMFVPEGQSRTFAELSHDEKNALSHRGLAVKELLAALRD
ncbi:MAG: RdgB/HAM1 family non-canonical purine NTP pyrophosphatase [Pseudomonadota bacterium]|nr:RdgB/HAM1 family non-canonical purine NTP pyrophosphatase [Pseudomonadota bacterium]